VEGDSDNKEKGRDPKIIKIKIIIIKNNSKTSFLQWGGAHEWD